MAKEVHSRLETRDCALQLDSVNTFALSWHAFASVGDGLAKVSRPCPHCPKVSW